jgi:hypothetical protein
VSDDEWSWDDHQPASIWPMVGTGILAVSAIVTVTGWWFFFREVWRWMR